MLVGVIFGVCGEEYWNMEMVIVDFFDMKGDLEVVFELIVKGKVYSFVVIKYLVLYLG